MTRLAAEFNSLSVEVLLVRFACLYSSDTCIVLHQRILFKDNVLHCMFQWEH